MCDGVVWHQQSWGTREGEMCSVCRSVRWCWVGLWSICRSSPGDWGAVGDRDGRRHRSWSWFGQKWYQGATLDHNYGIGQVNKWRGEHVDQVTVNMENKRWCCIAKLAFGPTKVWSQEIGYPLSVFPTDTTCLLVAQTSQDLLNCVPEGTSYVLLLTCCTKVSCVFVSSTFPCGVVMVCPLWSSC